MAIVGSGPGLLDNRPGFVDSHDVVVRVNNYRLLGEATGARCDVFYSFFGRSIHKTAEELQRDGVTLCMCKCPCALAVDSDWHRRRKRMDGVDFRWIYDDRADWWFCDTYVPTLGDFLKVFEMLGKHIPTTGFTTILDVLEAAPASVYITGFDFFRSRIHNVTEPWRRKNTGDPIGHEPERELAWLAENWSRYPLTGDPVLMRELKTAMVPA